MHKKGSVSVLRVNLQERYSAIYNLTVPKEILVDKRNMEIEQLIFSDSVPKDKRGISEA